MNGDQCRNAWPEQLNDVQRAVHWVRANAETSGVDPERIVFLGHSAGGQLASGRDEINAGAQAHDLDAALHEASVETAYVEPGRGGPMARIQGQPAALESWPS